ncbi:MAG: type II secretion system protein [Lachnospiraceae bacterium]|nr:type II secretion system protein [Lachnospiraceae bacterium]
MKRNEGLTLIELVVIIAIITVLISVVGISVTVISRQKVSNAVEDVKVLFQTAQTIAMSKDNCHIAISQNSDRETVFTLYSSTDNLVLNRVTVNRKVSVYIIASGSSTKNKISDVDVVRIYYDRVSGSFSDMYWVGPTTLSNGSTKGDIVPGGITDIIFSNDTSSEITLKLTKLTGRVSY